MIADPFNHLIEVLFAPLEASINGATPIGVLLFGLVIGLRHAMEADHVAAVSTIVASSDKKLGRAPILGALWGLGHTATLFVAGLVILLLAVSIPERVSDTLEFGVGIMLVFLGATTLTGFKAGKFVRGIFRRHTHEHVHVHEDSGLVHSHEHDHNHHDHSHGHKSIIIGMIHGMAGSGALMLVVLSTINSVPLGLAYIAIFGAGSIASMAAMSALIGLPFTKARNPKLGLLLRYVTAVITLAIGASLMYQLGVIEQVFL